MPSVVIKRKTRSFVGDVAEQRLSINEHVTGHNYDIEGQETSQSRSSSLKSQDKLKKKLTEDF